MHGLMMDYQLTVPAIVRRAEQVFGEKQVVCRLPNKQIHRTRYAEIIRRAKQFAVGLKQLGVTPGERVATLGWNHSQHLEAYLAIPSIGAVLHTLNLRLHHDDVAYIAKDADDRVLVVDQSLLPLYEQIRSRVNLRHVIVMARTGPLPEYAIDYEELLASSGVDKFEYEELDERTAAAMCYTSGTTGRPKGVLYSHRAIALHSLGCATVDGLGICEADVVLPVVPMFHINAWGLPFTSALVGAKLVLPGPFLDPVSLLELMDLEEVTVAAGVPTVWLGVLQTLDQQPGRYNLSHVRSIVVGGSAIPPSVMKAFQERHGVRITHAWGMTEMTPIGSVSRVPSAFRSEPMEAKYRYLAMQGAPMPFTEFRGRNETGSIPWDGKTSGELEVRGPWVTKQYYNCPLPDDRFTEDGWFRTGDIVTIDERGWIELRDRAKDLVKSGGEWISSVALENAIMAHPAVAEAAVIGVPHPKWDERPLAVVVLKAGCNATVHDLRLHLEPDFAKWWLPDAVEFVTQLPRTSTGKFRKSELRQQFRDYYSAHDGQTA